ncbi:hypothetical protein P5V15_001583 [Pogonomyrmex californicus]
MNDVNQRRRNQRKARDKVTALRYRKPNRGMGAPPVSVATATEIEGEGAFVRSFVRSSVRPSVRPSVHPASTSGTFTTYITRRFEPGSTPRTGSLSRRTRASNPTS